jgi:hypothetical protein
VVRAARIALLAFILARMWSMSKQSDTRRQGSMPDRLPMPGTFYETAAWAFGTIF